MKIRIRGNSIRLRLTRSEIEVFGIAGRLEDTTEFGDGAFGYAIQASGEAEHLSAFFKDGCITVLVPAAIQQEWTTTDKVGFDYHFGIGAGKSLYILIEKDFKCIDNSNEDQSDNYEHPTGTC